MEELKLSAGDKLVILSGFVALAFWMSLWLLGIPWWKAMVVGLMAAVIYRLGWAGRSMRHATVALVVLESVWIEVLPHPSEWKGAVHSVQVALSR